MVFVDRNVTRNTLIFQNPVIRDFPVDSSRFGTHKHKQKLAQAECFHSGKQVVGSDLLIPTLIPTLKYIDCEHIYLNTVQNC